MGEEVGGVPEAAAVEPERSSDPTAAAARAPGGDPADTSIGRYLARQRRLRQISLDELAALTRIPRRSLERLEAGAFDASPDGFARGFVRTVAQALGLDPVDAVMRLMQEPGLDEPGSPVLSRLGQLPLALLGLAAAAVLVSLLLWKLLTGWLDGGGNGPSPDAVLREDPVQALVREQAQRGGATPPSGEAEAQPKDGMAAP